MPSNSQSIPMVPRVWPAVFMAMVPSSTPKMPASRPRQIEVPASDPNSSMPQTAMANISSGPIFSRSEEPTSELQSLMRISYAVFCLKKKKNNNTIKNHLHHVDPTTTTRNQYSDTN